MSEENRNTYNISHVGASFNQSIQGNYTEVHGNYINNAAANGLIGQAAVEVIKLALKLSGVLLP